MSSLGDLLLGKIRDGSPNSEQEYENKKQALQNSQSQPIVKQEKDKSISFDSTDTLNIPLPEQPVKDEILDDNRSNASSTDDYVRELLDPNDRPRNVWHVVEGPKNDHSEIDGCADRNRMSSSPSTKNNDCNNSETSNCETYNNISPDQRIASESERPIEGRQIFDGVYKIEPHDNESKSHTDLVDRQESKDKSPSDRQSNNDRKLDKSSGREDDREKSRSHRRDRKSDRDYGKDRHSTSDRHRSRKRYDSDDDEEDLGRHRRSGYRQTSHSRSRSPSSRTSSRRRERSKSGSRSPVTQRNSRTILVMQLSPRVVTRDLEDLFRKIGPVKEVRLIMDVKAKRHKGIAYIEFEDAATASNAMALNGQKFMGTPMVIQSALNERYSSKGDRHHSSSSQYSKPYHTSSHSSSRSKNLSNSYRVYVGSLHVALTEDMIRSVFEPFGPIIKVELMKDRNTGVSRGYCFLTYANTEDGQEAVRCLDGFELAGKKLRVSKSADKTDH